MTSQTRIAVTNRTICYKLYKLAGLASAEDTPLTCLSSQIRMLLNNNSCDKILIREKDLSEKKYRDFITSIFAAHLSLRSNNLTSNDCFPTQNQGSLNALLDDSSPKYISHDGCKMLASRIIVHNFPEVAEEFGTDLHLPFSVFADLFGHEDRKKFPHIQKIGTSIHSVEDAIFAESHGANYITAGHIFTTDCKKGLPGRGIEWLESICSAVSIPVYAIGGISDANVSLLSDCSIAGYCMMSASMQPYFPE